MRSRRECQNFGHQLALVNYQMLFLITVYTCDDWSAVQLPGWKGPPNAAN
jgi:hypothetical protein